MKEKRCEMENSWQEKFFNIPPGEDFASSLVRGLEQRFSESVREKPDRYIDTVILLNNSRSLRRLENIFYESGITILPKLGLVTDISFLTNGSTAIKKEIKVESRLEKLLSLEKLVFGYLMELGHYIQKDSSFDLTMSLEQILHDLTLSGSDANAFDNIDKGDLSSHRIQSLGFLKIIKEYQVYLNKNNILDLEGLNFLWLKLIEEEWKIFPPNFPIIIAGSTGSRHTTARLMKAISKLPMGWVILPGVDETMTDQCWKEIQPDHPQYSFKKLYSYINGIKIEYNKATCPPNWTADSRKQEIKSRAKLMSYAMLPSKRLHIWQELKHELAGIFKEGLKKVSILEVSSSREEAETIALIVRMALEKKQTVSIVTPDIKNAKRVTQALKRWNITPDNSFGLDPLQTSLSRFIRLVLDFQCLRFDIHNFIALLKHPLCLKSNRLRHLSFFRNFEVRYLRGNTFEVDIFDLKRSFIKEKYKQTSKQEYTNWLTWIIDLLDYKLGIKDKKENYDLNFFIKGFESLVVKLNGLSQTFTEENKTGFQNLNPNDFFGLEHNSMSLIKIIEEIKANATHSRKLNFASFRAFFTCILKNLHIPLNPIDSTENVFIWGTLESRTQKTDICILSGLNEGVWPRRPRSDFWLNEKMRGDIGLQSQNHTLGLAAHDFQNAFMMDEVILSRSTFTDGNNMLPTRWLLRLQKLLSGAGGIRTLKELNKRGDFYSNILFGIRKRLYNEINLTTEPTVGLRPCPMPSVKFRPTKISISSFIRLINDPYEIYAREILELKKMDPVYVPFDSRLKGIFMHELMRKFVQETMKKKPDFHQWCQQLIEITYSFIEKNIRDPRVKIRLMAEIKNKVNHIITAEIERRKTSNPTNLEITGQKKFSLLSGIDIVLTAKADRIDTSGDNKVIILDYKSSKPSEKVFKLNMPQLDLEALLANYSAFSQSKKHSDLEVGIIVLGTKILELKKSINQEQVKKIEKGFLNIVERIFCDDWGYISKKSGLSNYSGDYDHLARYGEWSITDKPFPLKIDGS